MARVRVGNPEIDSQIEILEQIGDVANAQFNRRLTPNEARQQTIDLMLQLSEVGVRMFFAPYVETDAELRRFYEDLEDKYPPGPETETETDTPAH